MSIQIIEIRQFQGPATVELSGVGVPEIVEVRQGPSGLNGPNSVTSATTTDFSAGTVLTSDGSNIGAIQTVTFPEVGDQGKLLLLGENAIIYPRSVNAIDLVASNLIRVYDSSVGGEFYSDITATSISANRSLSLPDASGTIALTEDYTAGTATIDVLNATVQGTLTANHIHGNIAGSVYAHVRAGENLAKGDPVYVSGSHGSGASLIAIVSKADASNASKMPAVGVMDAAVSANANGHMVITGTISDIDTNAYAVNSVLYVASGGGWTSTPPAANSQPVAIVERSNTNNGAVIVKVNGLASSGGNGASDANKLARFSSTGTLPISNIGGLGSNVATFLATPTSANLAAAVTDETGTGSLVFSNAPTFTGGLQFSSSAVAATTRTNLGVLQTRSVTKASDETRTSTTFAADSDLVISLEANSTYKIELYYFHTIASGTLSARAEYTGTLLDTVINDTAGTYHGFSQGRWTWASVSPPIVNLASGTATTPVAWLSTFSLKTGDAGNFRLMWSGGTGTGGGSGNVTIKQGSRIITTKLL